ncbi:hypothetical protein [Magnetospirillum molischianum]|uniref:hypothetical protein n=1 Tax=Magnetospirillum molischianum TaxID=1083 RepID=UPI000309E733|nr:hypothetical protein [Magnetospirillum molischianum]
MNDVMIERRENPRPAFPLLNEMYVERGTKDDWNLYADLHYKSEGGLPAAIRFWRIVLRGETIGVLVSAAPKPLLKERHALFPRLKPGHDTKITNVHRLTWLNGNVRVIARFVVDTMYRGIGVGYRAQNLISRMEGCKLMEIQSSMSKFNFFAHRAGFRFVKPMDSNKFDVGIKFFRRVLRCNPADYEAIKQELASMTPELREWTIDQMREFYFKHSALEKTGARGQKKDHHAGRIPDTKLIKNLQQMVLGAPLYGVYQSPDWKRADLPTRLPLTAFDNQAPDQPLDLDKLS